MPKPKKPFYNRHPDQLGMQIPGEAAPPAPPKPPTSGGGEPPRRPRRRLPWRRILIALGGVLAWLGFWFAEGTRDAVIEEVTAQLFAGREVAPAPKLDKPWVDIAAEQDTIEKEVVLRSQGKIQGESPTDTGNLDKISPTSPAAKSSVKVKKKRATPSTNPLLRFAVSIGRAIDELFGYEVHER